jgi:hypothetical protein
MISCQTCQVSDVLYNLKMGLLSIYGVQARDVLDISAWLRPVAQEGVRTSRPATGLAVCTYTVQCMLCLC